MNTHQKIISTIKYHNQTKHFPNRSANSAGFMDWGNQPNPFRFYQECFKIDLPFRKDLKDIPFQNIYRDDVNSFEKMDLNNIGIFFEYALSISAWKSISKTKWALRVNPSSGNLHPTESYLVTPDLGELKSGLYHYSPYLHALEQRSLYDHSLKQKLLQQIDGEGFLIGMSSIYWRESWKYGERAFRYCHHDLGHALASLRISANLLGWKMTCLNRPTSEEIDKILGINQNQLIDEEEIGDILCFVHSPNGSLSSEFPSNDLMEEFEKTKLMGSPNQLSKSHENWEIINEVSSSCKKDIHREVEKESINFPIINIKKNEKYLAHEIIKKRRSAVDMDGKTFIIKDQFLNILDRTLARPHRIPFDLHLCNSQIHLIIFVNRVEELDQGIYILVRNPNDLENLKENLDQSFSWTKIFEDFPLYQLFEGDVRNVATNVSCGQEIAGDGAFSLGMLANFEKTVLVDPMTYPTLYWESGIIGQVLYLEAHANGVMGTGIGCFFDDSVHDLIGLKNNSFQSIYHFTIGGGLKDDRLQTLPPYHHLVREKEF
ncbi:MAG: SagB/ThcOx family dehydrogenase [Bacteriovoracaceae bacterium]|nr:SagB/ThcOx family dehydrogenase [Bacteriovoracaceae bacterium]